MDHTIIFETEVECPPETEALLDKVISAALEAEGVTLPCEISVLLTDDAGIHQINREMREVDGAGAELSHRPLGAPSAGL